MSEELKPCPFCGSPAHMWKWNYGVAIKCSKFDPKCLDRVDVIIGSQICFAGDDSDNYFDVVETFDELKMMIEQAEGTGDKDVV